VPHPVEEDVGVVDRVDIWVTASARPLARSGQRLNLSRGIIHLYSDEPLYCQKKCFDALEAKKYDKKKAQPK